MNKIKIKKCANDLMWVEYWVKQAHPSVQFEIGADPYKDKWKCEFVIPTINKTVSSISSTEVNAMLNASKKAKKIIKEYIKNHPEINFRDKYWSTNWEIEEDEEGHFMGLGKTSKYQKSESDRFIKNIGASRRAIESAIQKIARLFGSCSGLYIQVIDRSLIGQDRHLPDLEEQVWKNYEKEYGLSPFKPKWTTSQLTDESAIFIMFVDESPMIDKSKLN